MRLQRSKKGVYWIRGNAGRIPGALRRRRGVVAIQVAVMLAVLMGFAALTIDIGAMYNAKAELQRTADAAALAAATMLGEYADGDPIQLARGAAVESAYGNLVAGEPLQLNPATDIEFGRANYDPDSNSYTFTPTEVVPDAVRVVARRTRNSASGPVQLFFAPLLGQNTAEISAEAIAVMVPRDISIVADLSGSMNDDSELKNVHNLQINLFDVWAAMPIPKGNAGVGNGLDPPPPGNPHSENDQPGTGPGNPGNAGGNPNPGAEPFNDEEPHGPRWGWMTGWGSELLPGVYDPVTDLGLYYIPRYSTTTDSDVLENLAESGYSAEEQAALVSSAYDNNTTYYRNRVRVLLGLAGWKSKKTGGKYNGGPGNRDNCVDSNELWQEVDYPFDSGSWNNYIDYVKGTSSMTSGDSDFRYRYGIKTFVNFLLESRPGYYQTEILYDTPAHPVQAVKDAVQHMVEVISELETDDQVSLEIYGQSVHHEQDLTSEYFDVSERLGEMQAGHYDVWTNMGGGIAAAISELTESGRQRAASRKIIILLTDGHANVDEYGNTNDYWGGRDYAIQQATLAAQLGIRIFAVSNGYGADTNLMDQIAEIGEGEHFHAEGTIEEYSAELDEIFNTLGGKRPVELIK